MSNIDADYILLWQAKEVLYALCPCCRAHLPWLRKPDSDRLVASCCGKVYTAIPKYQASKFKVVFEEADTSNVRFLSMVDFAPTTDDDKSAS